MPILTVDEVRQNSGAIDLSAIEDDDLANLCDDVDQAIAAHCGEDFSFRTIKNEMRNFSAKAGLEFRTYHGPVRTITSLEIVTGMNSGVATTVPVLVTPIEVTASADVLPTVFGDVLLDRNKGMGQAISLLLATNGIPLVSFAYPQLRISYTCGYDNGWVLDSSGNPTTTPSAADGYVLPYPTWLKSAARWVFRDVVGEWYNAKRGMAGLLELRVGDTTYRRQIVRPKVDYSINPTAAAILQHHYNVWLS